MSGSTISVYVFAERIRVCSDHLELESSFVGKPSAFDAARSLERDGVQPALWKYESEPERRWTHAEIRALVVDWLHAQKMITCERQADLANALVDVHYIRSVALHAR